MPATTQVSRAQILAALTAAHRLYRAAVDSSWVPEYLNRRNLYSQFDPAGLGYAPAVWTDTMDELRRAGHTDAVLAAAGLVRRTFQGKLVATFRDRLMIPLTSSNGDLVGFTGRAAPTADADVPKYLNSPASDVFIKHELLYGLHEDHEALQHGAMPVVVEGPMDRLAITEAKRNLPVAGLAPCGTAFGASQAAALIRQVGLTRPIAVALDADAAGRQATRRIWRVLTQAGARHLRHLELPDGKDPAELVRAGRGSLLRHALTHTRPLAYAVADHRITDMLADQGAGDTDPIAEDWRRRLSMARVIMRDDLQLIPGDLTAGYITHLATKLQLDPELVSAAAADTITTA